MSLSIGRGRGTTVGDVERFRSVIRGILSEVGGWMVVVGSGTPV
jgi:hypothetical protein